MNLLIKDKDGNPSLTETVFLYGCLVCIAKLAFSGFSVGTWLQVPTFGGSDFGMAVGSLGGIYSLQNHVKNLADKSKDNS